jgi:hypothetical protein
MTDNFLDIAKVEEITTKYESIRNEIEGKKPVKPELVVYLINLFLDMNKNLEGAAKIVDTFNEEYSSILSDQIQKNNSLSSELQNNANQLSEKLQHIFQLEERIENINTRETQVNQLLQTADANLALFPDIKSILEISSSINELLEKSTANNDTRLQQLIDKINEFEMKSNELVEESKLFDQEKKEIAKKTDSLNEQQEKLDTQIKEIEEREKALSEKENKYTEMLEEINKNQVENQNIVNEIHKLHTNLIDEKAKVTDLLAEKTYLYKMEETIKERAKELEEGTLHITQQKETLHKQINQFDKILDKVESNLNMHEVTTEVLGGVARNLSSGFNSLSSVIDQLSEERNYLQAQGKVYEKIGTDINSQLKETSIQKENMVKLNVLSNYIHQTILELRSAEVSLTVLDESIQAKSSENMEIMNDIRSFMKKANDLFNTTNIQINKYIKDEQVARENLERINEIQLKMDLVRKELERIEHKKEVELKNLAEIEEKALELEQKRLKKKLMETLETEKKETKKEETEKKITEKEETEKKEPEKKETEMKETEKKETEKKETEKKEPEKK